MTLSMLAENLRRAGEREIKMAAGVNFFNSLLHEFSFFFLHDEGRMGVVVQPFFSIRWLHEKSRGESGGADRWTFFFRFYFFRAVFFRVVFMLLSSDCSGLWFLWCIFHTNSIGFDGVLTPGSVQQKKDEGQWRPNPNPRAKKARIVAYWGTKKAPKKQKWHPGAAVVAICKLRDQEHWSEGHEFTAISGASCIMLAVSTLRLDSIPKEGAGAPYDHTPFSLVSFSWS